jgi:cell division protein FtsW
MSTTPIWEGRLLGIIAVVLVAFGVVAVYGASSIWAIQRGSVGSFYAQRQLIGAIVGVLVMLVVSRIDYHVWQRKAWLLLGIAALVLLIPLLPLSDSIVIERNGARRWVSLGFATFQPSEFAKFAVIAWTAMLAAKKGEALRKFKRGLLPFIVILAPVSLLILLEPDLSTASLTVLLAAIVLFTAGAKIGHFLVVALVALPFALHSVASAQYRLQRMVSFLSPGGDLAEESWQISQSLIGFGSGRVLGVGLGEGLQKLGYLPYAYSDFIFSTIGEEWGFVGVTVVLLLYAAFMMVGFRVARAARDRFGMFLGVGLVALVVLTALLHVGVTLSLVPATGLPLPFVSFGRSNLIVSLTAVGVLINIASQGMRRESKR